MRRKNVYTKSFLLAFTVANILLAGQGFAGWLKSYDSGGSDSGYSFSASPGGFYQWNISVSNGRAAALTYVNNSGVPKWRRKIASGGYDRFTLQEASNGQVLLSGYTQETANGPGHPVWALFNVNQQTGALTPDFRKIVDTDVNFFNLSYHADTDEYLGVGDFSNSATSSDMLINKIDPADGEILWSRRLHYGAKDSAEQLLPLSGGYLLVGNTVTSDDSVSKILIGKLDSNGLPVAGSFQTYGGAGINTTIGLVLLQDGGYALVGTTTLPSSTPPLPGTSHIFVLRLTANLAVTWGKRYRGAAGVSLYAANAVQNADGSLLISAIHTDPPPATFFAHPVSLHLGLASGALLDKRRYESDGAIESGVFFRKNVSRYLYQGTTIGLTTQNTDMIYGEFDNNLQQVWLKRLDLGRSAFGSIIGKGRGYVLSGVTLTNNDSDFLLGSFDSTGTIPGCSAIQDATLTVTNPAITASALDWAPMAATVRNKGSITATDFDSLKNVRLTIPTVTTICD